MIVATAGHVDHGKTLLVKALTGIDTDRLPEEKERGMTIDLGFAYLPAGSAEPIGFVDVPGHARFVHNMLSGVAGIDFALLIVAADDGPMPQTEEHLAILDLLAISRGAIALTKVDRVPESRIAEVRGEIASLLSSSGLADAPVFPVSAISGEGVEALKAHLLSAARDYRARARAGNFRLAVDRCFTLPGAGLIVTGTAFSGSLSKGGSVRVLDAGFSVRARTIHAQNAAAESCHAGQRCALNLTGADLKDDSIRRGDWIVTGSVPEPVRRIDARLRILGSEPKLFAHWTPVHVHLGAAEVSGRVAILEGSSIAPGASALVQLVLDRPVGALWGDRFIIRDESAQRTIGGGRVIDVFLPIRSRRSAPAHLAYLGCLEEEDHEAALKGLLNSALQGLNLSSFAANRNLSAEDAAALFARVPMKSVAVSDRLLGFSVKRWQELKAIVPQALTAWHKQAHSATGLGEDQIFREAGAPLPREVTLELAAELVSQGIVVREAYGLRLPSHAPKLIPADAALWNKVAPLLDQTPLRPPTVHDIARMLWMDPKKTESFLERASHFGLLVRTSENRFFRPEALRRLGEIAEQVAAGTKDHTLTLAAFRDRAGTGRVVAVEILDFFDRIKFTRRIGDARQILRPAAIALG